MISSINLVQPTLQIACKHMRLYIIALFGVYIYSTVVFFVRMGFWEQCRIKGETWDKRCDEKCICRVLINVTSVTSN